MNGAQKKHTVRIVQVGARVLAVCSACNPEVITDGPNLSWAVAAAARHAKETGGVYTDPRHLIA
ncbi:hypothetical protein [Arthrobacter sp. NyZ413]|uniref:hypothetical protein n=1 Tax=Arthrobacter sp. NyZ413 TaxID=3144669 RepID=UPI003BF783BC